MSRSTLCLLVLITVLGAYLRGRCAGESLWVDELHTAWVVADGWQEVAPRARIGNHSPREGGIA